MEDLARLNGEATVALSLVIPAFNEAENLPILLAEIRAALTGLDRSYEVLLIDDGSTDATLAVARELAGADSRLRIVHMRRRSGQSAALAAGFRRARGEVVVTLDADLQNDPADIATLLAALPGADVVSGVRQKRQDSWQRRVASRIANAVRNRLTHESISDVGCSLKAYRAELLRDLPMFTGMHRFLPTLVRMQGARLREVPVRHRPRVHGIAKYTIGNRLWRALADLFAVRWMQSRWIDHRLAEEIPACPRTSSGPSSDTADRPSSSAGSSSSG